MYKAFGTPQTERLQRGLVRYGAENEKKGKEFSFYSSFAGTAINVSTVYCVANPVSIINFIAETSFGASNMMTPSYLP